jgi:hypothetical protein
VVAVDLDAQARPNLVIHPGNRRRSPTGREKNRASDERFG